MNDRERLWTAAYQIVEGLRPKFGTFLGINIANECEKVIYENVMNPDKITDTEVRFVVGKVKGIMNAP